MGGKYKLSNILFIRRNCDVTIKNMNCGTPLPKLSSSAYQCYDFGHMSYSSCASISSSENSEIVFASL
jgi:hypothetical protein